MFLGDLLFAKHVPALDGSIRGWLTLLDDVQARQDIKLARPRARTAASMAWPAAIAAEQRYLNNDRRRRARHDQAGQHAGRGRETAGLSEKDAWLLFKEYHARNVSAAFAELEWE